MRSERERPQVFISYAQGSEGESALAATIALRLRQNGCTVFIDQTLRVGQDWNAEIERHLDVCDAFCVLLSETSVASPMVQNEVARIGARRRRERTSPEIWPIRCTYDGNLPYDIGSPLRRIQYLTWKGDADIVSVLDQLLDRLRALREEPHELPPPSLCTLPGRLGDFTGREQELDELCRVLTDGSRRATVSAIGGMGGVGKTTLAIEAAWRVAGEFPDGVLFIDLRGYGQAPPLTPAEAIAAIVAQLEPTARLPDDMAQRLALYRRLLAGRRLLLLLDNARAPAQVEELVQPSSAAFLVTSRDQLLLPGAMPLDLDMMPPNDAAALLRGIVGPERADDAQLSILAERCGRLPLALRAAGAYLTFRRGLAVAAYLDLLAHERERLEHLRVPHARLDVRATLRLSVAALQQDDPELAGRWCQLAVFPAGFLPEAAAAVWQIDEAGAGLALDGLVARALLTFEPKTGRYRLHDLVREIAVGELDEATRTRAEQRHAEHYMAVLGAAKERYKAGGGQVLEGLRLFDAERSNIEAGQAWTAGRLETSEEAARLAFGFTNAGVYVLDLRLTPRQRIGWLESALAGCRRTAHRHGEGYALGNLGLAWAALGEARKAIGYYEQVLVIAREIGDRRGEGNALGNLGNAWADLGEARKAIGYYEQHLAIAQEIGDRRGEGSALGNLGLAWADLGEARKAIGYYEQALVIAREIGDRRGEGNALWNKALACEEMGEREQAVTSAKAALTIRREIEDPNGPKVEAWLRERGVEI